MAKDRTCLVCGTTYKYCNNCREYRDQPMWKMLYCSDDCRTVAGIIDKFRAKKVDANTTFDNLKEVAPATYSDLYQSFVNEVKSNMIKTVQNRKKKKTVVNDVN